MKRVIALLSVLIIFGCKNNIGNAKDPNKEQYVPKVNEQFQPFLDQFPQIQLPVKIERLSEIKDLKQLDQSISNYYITEENYIYGKFMAGSYIGIITLAAADALLPVVTLYNLRGDKIDSQTVAIGKCDSAPCEDCSESLTINKTLNIYAEATISKYDCNDGESISEKPTGTTIISKTGKITANGKIILETEVETKI